MRLRMDGDLVGPILDHSLVKNPGFRALRHRLLAFGFEAEAATDERE
jgi:hypothetical protein